MLTSIDVLEGYVQSELGTNDLRAILRLNERQFTDFGRALYEFQVAGGTLQSADTQISPAAVTVGPTHLLFFERLTRLNRLSLARAVFERPLQLLLYYPTVWIEDPLQWYANNVRSFAEYRAFGAMLSSTIEFFVRVRPLIATGVLRISPLNYPYHTAFNASVNRLDRTAYNDERVMSVLDRRRAGLLRAQPLVTLNRGIVTSRHLDAALVIRGRDATAIWRQYSRTVSEVLRQTGAQVETIASPLLNLPVPRFTDLSPDDLLAIRRDELAFAEWRGHVRQALESLNGEANTSTDLSRMMTDRLREGSLRLRNDLKKSSFRGRLRKTGAGFSIGSTTAFVNSGSLRGALLSGLAGALVTALFDGFAQRPNRSKHALSKHFSIFDTRGE